MPTPVAHLRASTSSLRLEEAEDEDFLAVLEPIHEAALFVEDALLYTSHSRPLKGTLPRQLHVISLWFGPVVQFAIFVLVAFSFLELPPWCASDVACAATLRDGRLTGNFSSGTPFFGDFFYNVSAVPEEDIKVVYPLFGLPILRPWISMLVESLMLIILAVHLACSIGAQGVRRYLLRGPRTQPLYLAIFCVSLVDSFVRLFWLPAVYLAPYLRVMLLCVCSPSILHELRLVRKTLWPLSGIALVLFMWLLFTSWMGVLFFAGEGLGSQGDIYFTNLAETAWSLFICLTTANYPDVMMPGFTNARISFFFFGGFVVIATFFLLNVVIAVVCNAYNELVDKVGDEQKAFRDECLAKAFELLDSGDGTITRERMDQLFLELNNYKLYVAKITPERAHILFALLDTKRTRHIDREEFRNLPGLLQIRLKRTHRTSWVGRLFPSVFDAPWVHQLGAVVRHRFFDYFIDAMLFTNAITLIVQEWDILFGNGVYEPDKYPWHQPVEWAFTTIFALEMATKLLALGWYEYTAKASNCFDGAVTTISLAVALGSALGDFGSQFVRYILAVRLGRFGRLIATIPQVSLVVATFFRMLPAARQLLCVLFVVMFTFASFGCQVFGGVINRGPVEGPVLAADAFGQANYYANNFNDLAGGMIVGFELLVVNNWFIICGGFEKVFLLDPATGLPRRGGPALVRLFFVSVYVLGVLVFLNVVVAFAIDSFEKEKHRMEEGARGGGGAPSTDAELDEADGGGIEMHQIGREFSTSIQEAQRNFRVVVPSHHRQAGTLKRLVAQATQRTIVVDSPDGVAQASP